MICILKNGHCIISLLFKATFALLVLLSTSCSEGLSSFFVDSRDGQKYKIVGIGKLIWMADNLNFDAAGSLCYENKPESCAKYGRLYNWEAALKVCPAGWHLPSRNEWDVVVAIRDSAVNMAFTSPGGGYRNKFPSGFGQINNGYWWSATEFWRIHDFNSHVYSVFAPNNKYFLYRKSTISDKEMNFSVRCVKDYSPDSAVAEQIKKRPDRIDSLLLATFKSIHGWCGIVEKDISLLRRYSIKQDFKEDYIFKYYEERCAKPLETFMLSVDSIDFNHERTTGGGECFFEACSGPVTNNIRISVTKTAAGAKAKLKDRFFPAKEMVLSASQWRDFLRALYRSGASERGRKLQDISYPRENWDLRILPLDKNANETLPLKSTDQEQSTWDDFMKLMDDMKNKINTKNNK